MKQLVVTIAIILAGFVTAEAQTAATPTIVLKDINGKTVRLSDFKGKVVLLNFWATWCIPCGAEVPDLVRWQTEYKDQDLQMIGITYPPTNLAAVRRFARAKKMNYPILLGTEATKKLFDASETLPITVIIGRDGSIKDRIDGVIFQDEFDGKVMPLLKP